MSSSPKATTTTFLGTKPSPDNFRKWCKGRDVFLHPDMGFLVQTKTMGMGVFAKRPLPTGTVVVSCPAASAMSPYSQESADSPCITALSHSEEAKKDPVLHVVMRLLAELCRPSTPWRAWLEACPRMSDHLFDLNESQSELLGMKDTKNAQQSASWTGISQQLHEMKVASRWAAAQKLMAAHPQFWPANKATFELFCECMAQVSSRNFHREEIVGREGPYLLPGLDVINHSFYENAKFELRGGGRKHETTFTVVTSRPLQRGEQVFCSYGHIGAARFAVEFQFTTASVQQEDMVRFSAATLVSMCAAMKAKAEDDDEARSLLVADATYRVDHMQRLGLLYDEGFYLLNPGSKEQSENAGGHAQDRDAAQRQRAETVANHFRVLALVADLLFADRPGFDDKYRRLTRDSEPVLSTPLKQHIHALLEAKIHSAQTQDSLVDEHFPSDADAVRRTLLHATLRSEMSILRAYQTLAKDADSES